MEDNVSATAYFRRAQCAFSGRQVWECLEFLERAELHGCDADECSAYRWQCWMMLGHFEWAWQESDGIAKRGRPDPHRFWDGRSFAGNRVIIRTLHGFGDAIQFVRYAKLVRRQAARVTVQTHPQLVSLFRGLADVDSVIAWDEDTGEWDQQIEVMELPRAFRTTLATIPAETPYLSVDPSYIQQSRRRLGVKRGPRVGLLWQGSDYNPARNASLSDLRPVLEIPDVEFYSFQRGPGRDELEGMPLARRIPDLSGDTPDVVHFAADLMNMDLLISVDTMGVHLAGALGIPVWVLLSHEADWRWMLDREDSPWYPAMRLFRQTVPGDWRGPVARMAARLVNRTGIGVEAECRTV